jgi:hypothetical protein
MAIVFESNIGIEPSGVWFIEIKDTQDGRTQKCYSIEEYSECIEDFGSDYGGQIDEVRWSKDPNVHPYVMNEIRALMLQEQEEINTRSAQKESC